MQTPPGLIASLRLKASVLKSKWSLSNFVFALCLISVLVTCRPAHELGSTAVPPNWEQLWRKVDSLAALKQPESALAEVKKIKSLALEHASEAHLVKSIINEAVLTADKTEEPLYTSILSLEDALSKYDGVVGALISSYLAQQCERYLMANRWRFTEQVQVEDSSILSTVYWERKTADLHFRSVADSVINERPLASFSPLLDEVADEKTIWSKLGDLLYSRAIDYFSSNNAINWSRSEQRVEEGLMPVSQFLTIDSFEDRTLALYQRVLDLHRSDRAAEAFADWNLKRLQYAYQQSQDTDREGLYQQALERYANELKDPYAKSMVTVARARFLIETDDLSDSMRLKFAHDLAQQAIQLAPDGYAFYQAKNILSQLEKAELHLQSEAVVPINDMIPVHLRFRNVDTVHWFLYRIPNQRWWPYVFQDPVRYFREDLGTPLLQGEQTHDFARDYREHGLDFQIEGQIGGAYLLLATDQRDPVDENALVTATILRVSDLAVHDLKDRSQRSLVCLDRQTGAPRSKVSVFCYQSNRAEPERIQLVHHFVSDSAGMIDVPQGFGRDLQVKVVDSADTLWLTESLYPYFMNTGGSERLELKFWTDRAVYQPGQVVFFKGLLLQYDRNNQPTPVKGRNLEVVLFNANGQELASLELASNEYGSVAGSFILPMHGLKGTFSLGSSVGGGRHTFRVESYEKPGFEVSIEPSSQDVKLGDTIVLKGAAVSYAGVPLRDVEVNINVSRRRIWWRYFSGGGRPGYNDREETVFNGTVRTNELGVYQVEFPTRQAIPGGKQWVYHMEVQVTDVSGESQRETMDLHLTDVPFRITSDMSQEYQVDSMKALTFRTVNFMDVPVPVTGKAFLIRQESSTAWTKKAKWQDMFDPGDRSPNSPPEYRDTIHHIGFSGSGSFSFSLQEVMLQPGAFLLVVEAQNAEGDRAEFMQPITLFEIGNTPVPASNLLFLPGQNYEAKVNDTIDIPLASPVSGWCFWHLERPGNRSSQGWLLMNGWEALSFPVLDSDRGGMHLHLIMVYANRRDMRTINIDVPWTEKQLRVNLSRSKDIMAPGGKDTVQVKVKDSEGHGTEAELLLCMYDSALDAIEKQYWQHDFYPSFGSYAYMQSFGFDDVYSTTWHAPIKEQASFPYRRYRSLSDYWQQYYGYHAMAPMAMEDAVSIRQTKGLKSSAIAEAALEEESKETIREDFQETIFFIPLDKTDSLGQYILEYEMGDALTKWRFMVLAHTRDLKTGYAEVPVITRQSLMITSNRPSFFRAGDQPVILAKMDNVSEQHQSVKASIEVREALTGVVRHELVVDRIEKQEEIAANGSVAVSWQLSIPIDDPVPLEITIRAISPYFSDAEKVVHPIYRNRQLVTEAEAVVLHANDSIVINLPEPGDSGVHFIEVVPNPTWYALLAMPNISTGDGDQLNQVWNRVFVNMAGLNILQSLPGIKAYFQQWAKASMLNGSLDKNAGITGLKPEQTPWKTQADTEGEAMQEFFRFFNESYLQRSIQSDLLYLKELQNSDGGFPWSPGGPSQWYITQYILGGMGDLLDQGFTWITPLNEIQESAWTYCDAQLLRYYQSIQAQINRDSANLDRDWLNSLVIGDMYVRQRLQRESNNKEVSMALDFFLEQAIRYWPERNLAEQAQLAFAIQKEHDNSTAWQSLIQSLRERLVADSTEGMHWRYERGYGQFADPVITHTLLMQVFLQLTNDQDLHQALKHWLIQQKRTRVWTNLRATVAAIHALMSGSVDWLGSSTEPMVLFKGGPGATWQSDLKEGLLFYKWDLPAASTQDKQVILTNPGMQDVWVSVFHSYESSWEAIGATAPDQPLHIRREILRKVYEASSTKLEPVSQEALSPGDRLVVRLTIDAEYDLDFVHLSDQIAAGLIPLSYRSGYLWQSGLNYYRSIGQQANQFFIDFVPEGTHLIEYELIVGRQGVYQYGPASLQSLFAPEYRAHTEGGIRLNFGGLRK